MRRVALILGLATCATAGAIGALPTAAAADCSGPMIEVSPTTAGRGGQVTVTGEAFGDNCYDTGPPPAGEGTLGKPIEDIEIVFVQLTTEVVVARGNADAEYELTVDVEVPTGLQPGDGAVVQARTNGVVITVTPATFLVSDGPLAGAPSSDVAKFGPAVGTTATTAAAGEDSPEPDPEGARAAEAADSSTDSDDDSSNALPIAAGAVAVTALAAAAVVLVQRRRRNTSPLTPTD